MLGSPIDRVPTSHYYLVQTGEPDKNNLNYGMGKVPIV